MYGVSINWLAVVVAAVAAYIVGWLWYGVLFGKTWMKLNKMSPADIKKAKQKGMATPMILNFIGTLVTVYVLAVLIGAVEANDMIGAVQLAFWIWLGFLLATTVLGSVLWDGKPWGLFVLNGAYWLVSLEVVAIVLSLF